MRVGWWEEEEEEEEEEEVVVGCSRQVPCAVPLPEGDTVKSRPT